MAVDRPQSPKELRGKPNGVSYDTRCAGQRGQAHMGARRALGVDDVLDVDDMAGRRKGKKIASFNS